jgi:DNA-directed RNA polymerase specialized sigma24 family protein
MLPLVSREKATEALDELLEQEIPCEPSIPLDLRLDLTRALKRLTPPYREVLILRDVHELTTPEVAA